MTETATSLKPNTMDMVAAHQVDRAVRTAWSVDWSPGTARAAASSAETSCGEALTGPRSIRPSRR